MGEEGPGEEAHTHPGGGLGVIWSPVIPWNRRGLEGCG